MKLDSFLAAFHWVFRKCSKASESPTPFKGDSFEGLIRLSKYKFPRWVPLEVHSFNKQPVYTYSVLDAAFKRWYFQPIKWKIVFNNYGRIHVH
jgi:hypothetical protein